MPKSQRYDRQNPVFAKASTGVAANHSSAVPSTESSLTHAQSDEALVNEAPPLDPNISGRTATEDCYTWLAGKMDGWRENDDYRAYFENSRGCDGMLVCDPNDGDYDDNGGYPTGVGESYGIHGSGQAGTTDGFGGNSFSIGTVITRRI